MEILVGQLLGLVGIFLLVAVFQVNDRHTLLRIQIVSCLVWAVYYAFMSAYTAAGLIFLGALRCYAFDKYRQYEWLYGLTIITYAIATLVTWKDWTSIMAFMGMTLATTAMWQQEIRRIRAISLTVTPFWLTYNFLNHSYLGMVGDLTTWTSVVIGTWRFDLQPMLRRRFGRHKANEEIEADSGIMAA